MTISTIFPEFELQPSRYRQRREDNGLLSYLQFIITVINYPTPCNLNLLENPIAAQLMKKLSAFCGTEILITVFTRSHRLSLS